MILSLSGLTWDIQSPSHYKLVLPRDTGDHLDIAFLGDRWVLFQEYKGHVNTREFSSRDQAMGLVAEAFKREGVL